MMIFFFYPKLTDLLGGMIISANYCDNRDLASGDLYYVSFVFVAQIKFQVEDYLCRHIIYGK